MVKSLVSKAKENGVNICLETPVKELVMDKKKCITGVIAQHKNGNAFRVYTKTVIISSGDFSDDKEMLEKYTKVGNAVPLFNMNMMGDGIQMAWAVGAAPEGTHVVMVNAMAPGERPNSHMWAAAFQPFLWINQQAERFCAEDVIFHFPFAGNALANQTRGAMYVIFDENTKKYMMEKGIYCGIGEVIPVATKLTGLDDDIQRGIKEGKAVMANSLNELAIKMGVNGRVLQDTVSKYNKYCEMHHDEIFFKNANYLHPVKMPKFYSVKSCLHILVTLGGIKINYTTEVLNKKCEVIPGLYATGNCAGGLYGDSYDVSITTGGALGFAVNSGRIAGENVLKYIGR
jgi:fumarate reductase flavoprotein subunit